MADTETHAEMVVLLRAAEQAIFAIARVALKANVGPESESLAELLLDRTLAFHSLVDAFANNTPSR